MTLKLLDDKFSDATPAERQCTLAFDEMSTDQSAHYFNKTDQIIGPHRKMQVTAVRGIIGHWKQPIHFDFDFRFHTNSLMKLISDVYQTGLNVRGTI
jgi:Transposase protein